MIDAALLGRPLAESDTPTLVIDLDRLDRNIARGQALVAEAGLSLRPHTKTHKSPIIAHMQMAAGAAGVCCAKLGEAEVMAAGGVPDILITTEVVGAAKIRRLIAVARMMAASGRRIAVVADDPGNVTDLAAAAEAAGLTLPVVVDVNVGMSRTGAPAGTAAAALAERVAQSTALRLAGLQGYHGQIQMREAFQDRSAAVRCALEPLLETAERIRRAGIEVPVLTGGGTGTSIIDVALKGLNEIQAGSYVFMDSRYGAIDWNDRGARPPYENALTVHATVVSRPTPDRATVDVGMKAASNDQGQALPIGLDGARFLSGGDEHGILVFEGGRCPLSVGDRVTFCPSHCDTTVNLYDRFVCVRNGVVEAVWPVAARGRSQ